MRDFIQRFFVAALFMIAVETALGQELQVVSFDLIEGDLTANLYGTTILDQNGEKCALLKIRTTEQGLSFDVGSLGVAKTEQKQGEVWVYVPHGVKKIKLHHQDLGVCEYNFPMTIEKARTYLMTLSKSSNKQPQDNVAQYLVIGVEPKDAIVEIDGEFVDVNDGFASKYVKKGVYHYHISATDYHDKEGDIEVSDLSDKIMMNFKLDPAFGWLNIYGYAEGAMVYVDSKKVGQIPLLNKNITVR